MYLKNYFLLLITLISLSVVNAQNDSATTEIDEDPVLFTIDNDAIHKEEFLRVYNKNIDILEDEEQRDVNNYLDLFVNYKLKVTEALELGYDEKTEYKKELAEYKKQLLEPYLVDNTNLDFLVKQAYDRSLEDVNASHILVRVEDKSTDTVKAYKKIMQAYQELGKGKSFESIALKYSEDPSASKNKGNLGYFTVFQMVYPFENAAYETKVGEYSKPFRTSFGYHIVKVHDKRKSQGKRIIAHIFKREVDSINAKAKIYEIYNQLKSGEDFRHLARTQSDDRRSGMTGGDLGEVEATRLDKEFSRVVFLELDTIGQISNPFKSSYGWHIVKLQKKFSVKSFEESKTNLTRRVKGSDRYSYFSHTVVDALKEKYNITVHEDALADFRRTTLEEAYIGLSKPLLSIEKETLGQEYFAYFLKGRRMTDELWAEFIDKQVLDYYKKFIEGTNESFIYAYQEYQEGLLLFYLLEDKVWNKSKDSVAIEKYYNENPKNYTLNERIGGDIISSTDKKSIKKIKKLLKSGISIDSISGIIETDSSINAIVNSGEFDKENTLMPEKYKYDVGISKIFKSEENRYVLVNSNEILPVKVQELSEVRGRVISDYQEYLEEEWVDELHQKYKVEFNDEVVQSLQPSVEDSESEQE